MFDEQEVERLRSVYNKDHPSEDAIPKGRAETVWRTLQSRLSSKCKTGRVECIVGTMLPKPKAPADWGSNQEEWLSSDDIDAVEKGYSKIFADYYYVGTVPIDFDLQSETRKCLVSTLCAINLPELARQGKERIGIVVNTDTHDGPGKHWVALFCDVRAELAYPRFTYFDSYAYKPEREIRVLMQRWKKQWDATKIHSLPMKLTYNKTRHQFKDTECGMYSLYFHYACLLGLPMDERIPDDVINGFRGLLFRLPKIDSKPKE